jgi:large subunit ribosomal protein L4
MEALAVYSRIGEKTGSMAIPPEIVNFKPNKKVIYYAIKGYLSNQAQRTAKTKGRSEVSGGGIKPWRQKGTGRARAGSIRSPLWRGGGIVFGPQMSEYNYKVNKKTRKLALNSVLYWKLDDGKVLVLDSIKAEGNQNRPKTKDIAALLKALKIAGTKVLFIIPEPDELLWKSTRNIPKVVVRGLNQLNTYDALNSDHIVTTKQCLESLKEMF